jgi:hypothetical protein
MQGTFGNKPLFGLYDEVLNKTFKSLGTYVGNTRKFMEVVKVIFKQQGFVASGLTATIQVAKKPVNFNVSVYGPPGSI